jgi:ADP-ribose pyrophosphatase YjhB (NUDIX family)
MTNRRVNVRSIIFKDGMIFAQELKANTYWSTPGGGLEPDESLTVGLYREMIEETGIAPIIGRLLFIQQFHDGNREQMEFFFHVTNADDYDTTIDLSATSHGELEVSRCQFIDPTSSNILPEFLQTIDIRSYIENNLPVYVTSELTTKE